MLCVGLYSEFSPVQFLCSLHSGNLGIYCSLCCNRKEEFMIYVTVSGRVVNMV